MFGVGIVGCGVSRKAFRFSFIIIMPQSLARNRHIR